MFLYPKQYEQYYRMTKFLRDVFHILHRLEKFLETKHADYHEAFNDFADIFQRLRKPQHPLDITEKYLDHYENCYRDRRDLIINLIYQKVDFRLKMGEIMQLLSLIKKTGMLSQWYIGTVLAPFCLQKKM